MRSHFLIDFAYFAVHELLKDSTYCISSFRSDRIDIYTNPSVEPFPETRYYRVGDDSLTINGKDLNVAATERDFSVKIGGIDCPLTSVANRVITCIPPSVKPLLPSGTQPEVVVKIGNLKYGGTIFHKRS